MSFFRALRAYVGLGPDDELEGQYLDELNARRRELELDEIYPDRRYSGEERARRRARIAANEPALDLREHPEDEFAGDFADDGFDEYGDEADVEQFGDGKANGGRSRRSLAVVGRASRRRSRSDEEELDADWGGESPFGSTDGLDMGFIESLDVGEHESGSVGHGSEFDEDDSHIDLRTTDERPASPFDEITSADDRLEQADEWHDDEEEAKNGRRGAVVHSLDQMRTKPKTLLPESFADAKDLADEFQANVPVVLNLQGLDRPLARRLIDFASGVCYVLDGRMEKIASQVFLLIPDGMEVSAGDRRLIEERGYAR